MQWVQLSACGAPAGLLCYNRRMTKKIHKTNAMRLLENASVSYRTASYEVDENDLGGVHVAELLGQPAEQVFKTLVLQGERIPHLVCCIPSNCELDLKKVARVAGGMTLIEGDIMFRYGHTAIITDAAVDV